MPQFNAYPALQARGIDMAAVERQRQDRKSAGTLNALREAKTQELQGAQGRREQTEAKAQAKQSLETVANLLKVVESAPPNRREQMYPVAIEHARTAGIPVDKAPPAYGDGNWTRLTIAQAGKELDSLSGKGRTALQLDVPYIAKLLGISDQDALAIKIESKSKGYDAYESDIAGRYVSYGERPEQAFEKATALADLIYGRTKKEPPEGGPDSEEGRDYLKEFFGFFGFGDDKEPAKPKAVPKAKKDTAAPKVSTMSIEQIRAHVQELKASGKNTPQDALNEIDARIRSLGVN